MDDLAGRSLEITKETAVLSCGVLVWDMTLVEKCFVLGFFQKPEIFVLSDQGFILPKMTEKQFRLLNFEVN